MLYTQNLPLSHSSTITSHVGPSTPNELFPNFTFLPDNLTSPKHSSCKTSSVSNLMAQSLQLINNFLWDSLFNVNHSDGIRHRTISTMTGIGVIRSGIRGKGDSRSV
ncbi:hypothetical protein WICPIJ_008614 [Wickerhamomyces pijperi]|uniref:Uncharacterized protein n=1 Tax=Wickerhamomyces pijperi TaxID=599730 RepID=A0A9P8PW43_WICPI|nr:hypothetical protein WICPIJ_008614 [Wickerhamomyces pijperi]